MTQHENDDNYTRFPDQRTDAPAASSCHLKDMPAPRDHAAITTKINWQSARERIDEGLAVVIVAGPKDSGILIDAIQQHLGFNLVIRSDFVPGWVYFCRPEAYERYLDGDVIHGTNDQT